MGTFHTNRQHPTLGLHSQGRSNSWRSKAKREGITADCQQYLWAERAHCQRPLSTPCPSKEGAGRGLRPPREGLQGPKGGGGS